MYSSGVVVSGFILFIGYLEKREKEVTNRGRLTGGFSSELSQLPLIYGLSRKCSKCRAVTAYLQ